MNILNLCVRLLFIALGTLSLLSVGQPLVQALGVN